MAIEFESGFLKNGGIDLHTHSFCSDGQYQPRELVERASRAGLQGLALTDHDTVAGLDEFMAAGESRELTTVPAVEISSEINEGRFHILGYYINWDNPRLRQRLNYFEQARADRVYGMLDVLESETGIQIEFEEVADLAGKNLIGKPHVAQAMVENGVVSSVDQAFVEYLAHGQPLDEVPKERMGLREAVTLINEAGGVPVLAHPIHYEPEMNLARFTSLGLKGLEVFYPDHSREDCERYYELARKYNLVITGGSDFHGSVKPEIELGNIRISSNFLTPLQKECRLAGGRFDLYANQFESD